MRFKLKYCFVIALLFIGACSPMVQRSGTINQAPELKESQFIAQDGVSLPIKQWPALEDEKAVIVAVHGFNDYRNGFSFPASWWMQKGLTTYAYDQRGFGETEQRGIWATSDRLTGDLSSLVTLIKTRHPGKPVYLLGESMGGAVVIRSVTQANFPEVDGVILSAPAVWGWKSLNLFYKSSLWVSAHFFGGVKASGKGLGIQASDNIPMLRNLGRDPYFIKKTRLDAVYGLVGLMDDAYESAEKMTLPTLVLYGANDQVIPKKPVEDVVQRLPKSADIVLYDKGWHLLLRDLQAPVVWEDIRSWIEKKEIPSGSKVRTLPLFPDDA
ncbi:lysophospholipase [Sneathiella sp.]|jgi:acylglycerol lipase|uniref:alpha/beta hydrolase n=1 Tax=Sneathiella sp. TaxID=1964365 RepID=UPI0039E5F412